MAELKNPKHERFVQNIVRGLPPPVRHEGCYQSKPGRQQRMGHHC